MPYAPHTGYTGNTTTPAPKTTPMIYGSEVHAARHPVVAYTIHDVVPMMPTTTPTNDSEALGCQSPNRNMPAQPQLRIPVQDQVAALETDIRRFAQDTAKGPILFRLSSLDDGDSADWHQTNQHPTSSLEAHTGPDKAHSIVLSSDGSSVSQSLDGHKYDRDMARKEVEIAQAKQKVAQMETKTREAEMRLLQMDASVGLSRRSRNSSEASSVRSEGQSAVSSSHRSRRRHSPRELNKERSLGSQIEEVLSTVDEHAIAPHDDSHGTMLYYSPHESSSRSWTSAGDASAAAADVSHANVAYKAPLDNSTATVAGMPVVQTPVAHTPVVQTPVVQAPVVQMPVVQTPVVHAPVVQTPVVQAPVAQTPVAHTPVVHQMYKHQLCKCQLCKHQLCTHQLYKHQ
jgi:hypothetical protein